MKRILLAIALCLTVCVSWAGKPCTTCADLAPTVQTGTFTSSTTSTAIQIFGPVNVSFWGTFSASVQIQRSFDGGTTWINIAEDISGTPAAYTTAISLVMNEPEPGVLYQLNCTYTSGTVNYRISGGTRNS